MPNLLMKVHGAGKLRMFGTSDSECECDSTKLESGSVDGATKAT